LNIWFPSSHQLLIGGLTLLSTVILTT
jgi:hypothetical protein